LGNNTDTLEKTIACIEPSLRKYIEIMNLVHNVDVSEDTSFQRLYNGYYRVRQRKPEFYSRYYSFMESNKIKGVSFKDALLYLYREFGWIEASFSSKLVATINPDMPIWDSVVLGHLQLHRPQYASRDRIKKTIDIYDKICDWYQRFLHSSDGMDMIRAFDQAYPYTDISAVKKVDFILWQTRIKD